MLEESTGNFSASRNVYDWYQTNTHVNINIMIKNLTESDVKVRLIDETLDVSCNLADGSEFKLHFNLFKSIFVNESSWTVTPSKLEIKLKKMDRKRWQSLEVIPDKSNNKRSLSSPPSFLTASPSSSVTASSPKRFMTAASADHSLSSDSYDDMPEGKLKYDWYQSDSHVTVAVMIRNLLKDETQIEFGENSATALLKLPDGSDYKLQLVLNQAIVPATSSYNITASKLELKMTKAAGVRWLKLEADPNPEAEEAVNSLPLPVDPVIDHVPVDGTYSRSVTQDQLVEAVACAAESIAMDGEIPSEPNDVPAAGMNGASGSTAAAASPAAAVVTSVNEDSNASATSTGSGKVPKGAKNWDKIVKEYEEEEEKNGEKDVNDLFKQIYSQGDEEMRKAMNKSFQESGGTVLSTNWDEVRREKVTVKPPDDCEFKKWD